MYICSKCGQTYDAHCNFCSLCGSDSIVLQEEPKAEVQPEVSAFHAPESFEAPATPVAPTYEAPAAPTYEAPAYSAPAYEGKVLDNYVPSNGPAIVGFIMGIIALIFALYAFIFATEASYFEFDEAIAAFVVCSIFQTPAFIVGVVQSFRARALKALALVGKITSFAALGMLAATLFYLIDRF